jgi:hypothetical protein
MYLMMILSFEIHFTVIFGLNFSFLRCQTIHQSIKAMGVFIFTNLKKFIVYGRLSLKIFSIVVQILSDNKFFIIEDR